MTLYRYHRMAANNLNWTQPHSGRLEKTDCFVGSHGFGVEDWNFSPDLWSDDRLHLYLKGKPATADKEETFSIAFGTLENRTHWLIGLATGVKYDDEATLPQKILCERASQLQKLDTLNSVSGHDIKNTSLDDKIRFLRDLSGECWVSVKPQNLSILAIPIPIPNKIVKGTATRYQLMKLEEKQFKKLASLTKAGNLDDDSDEDFSEGKMTTRYHAFRERNSKQVQRAKKLFIKKHGALHCEACGLEPENIYDLQREGSSIIEAHHDVPLSKIAHNGKTKVSDLKMLCPNCHRAIHVIQPWRRVSEFRKLVQISD